MIAQNSVEVLSHNGKSFYLAGLFLEKQRLSEVAVLYSFCRYVDDCADKMAPEEALHSISRIEETLANPLLRSDLQSHINHLESNGVERRHMLELVAGARSDIGYCAIRDDDELDHYCYQVAGVVGLMMLPLIGVLSEEAERYAVSLGKGMQLTNICRDILEDAQNGRTYLPQDALRSRGLSLGDLQKAGETPTELKELVRLYLRKADELYHFSYKGLAFIPLRYRFAILFAGEIYRHIGVKIARNNYEVLKGRTVHSLPTKIFVIIKSLRLVLKPRFWII